MWIHTYRCYTHAHTLVKIGLEEYWYGIKSVPVCCRSVPFCNTAYASPLEPYLWIWILQNEEATSTNSQVTSIYPVKLRTMVLVAASIILTFFLSLQVWVLYTSYSAVLRFQNRRYPYPAASLFLSSKQHLQKTFAGAVSSSGSYMFLFQADSNGLCLCFMLACILYMHDVESPASQQDLLSFDLLDCCTRHRPGLDHKHDELPQTCAVLHRSEYFSYEQNKAT